MRSRRPRFPLAEIGLTIAVIGALWAIWTADASLTAKYVVTAVLAIAIVAAVAFYLGQIDQHRR